MNAPGKPVNNPIVELIEKTGAALELLRDSDAALKKISGIANDAGRSTAPEDMHEIIGICELMRSRIDDLLAGS